MFSTTDKEWHRKLRRAVSNAFSLSTMVQYEPMVDRTITAFLRQIDIRFANKSGFVDFATWAKFFALDVIGQLTYGASLGMLETGYDHLGVVEPVEKILRYLAVVSHLLPSG